MLAVYWQRLKNIYHFLMAVMANLWYGFPSRKLQVIGVTGTDGKTTTTHLIYHILTVAKKNTAMISTVEAVVGKEKYRLGFHVTNPGPWLIQKLMRRAVDNNFQYFVLETTSHGLDQHRNWGIKFAIGLITNITREHLDYHRSYQAYLETKLKLLYQSKTAFINQDDTASHLLKKYFKKANRSYKTYDDDYPIIDQVPNLTRFNRYNYAAAYVVAKHLGFDDQVILNAMRSFHLPTGRLETVYDRQFKVIIDFAHTPNAITNLLASLREIYSRNTCIIHIFGAAGLRDQSKRPLMGEASGQLADLVILTEEDYRTEDPIKICDQIKAGLLKSGFHQVDQNQFRWHRKKTFTVEVDRQAAINLGIATAKKGDIVVITGKGHEQSLCRNQREYPWDEKKAVNKAIEILKSVN